MHMRSKSSRMVLLPDAPLARLLLVNLVIGAAVTLLLVGGLLLLNPAGLRDLIFADHSPGIALALLLMSFFITFGSTAMGTAIMALGQRERDEAPRGPRGLAVQEMIRKDQS
jgi:hypothetical protein